MPVLMAEHQGSDRASWASRVVHHFPEAALLGQHTASTTNKMRKKNMSEDKTTSEQPEPAEENEQLPPPGFWGTFTPSAPYLVLRSKLEWPVPSSESDSPNEH
tara:strand:- start:6866 stop:7174 length:309 start_codon:yes stop_codon:yes gene_type:complete